MNTNMPVYHCKCCGKLFPSTITGLINCPICGREFYDVVENGQKALYSAVEQVADNEARDFWMTNPAAVPYQGDPDTTDLASA